MYARPASLVARGSVYCGNGYAATHERRGVAQRAYIVERLHLAVGRADMPSFSDFQKFNMSLTIESIAK